MTDQAMSPLRRRMIEDMTIRKFAPKTQHDYLQRVKNFAAYLGRSPDTASSEDVRRYQLHLTASGVGGVVALEGVNDRNDEIISYRPENDFNAPDRMVPAGPINPVGLNRAIVQFRFSVGDHQPLFENESSQNANRKRAATEAEQINLRALLVIVIAANESARRLFSKRLMPRFRYRQTE
jgi:hypothetical protein